MPPARKPVRQQHARWLGQPGVCVGECARSGDGAHPLVVQLLGDHGHDARAPHSLEAGAVRGAR